MCSHQRERWHIRPEGTSLLEPHSPPFLSSPSPPFHPYPPYLPPLDPLPPRTEAVKGQTQPSTVRRLPCSAALFLCSNYAMIQCNIPLQLFPHKFISRAIMLQRVRSFTSQRPSTIQQDAGFYIAAKCAKSPRLNGNLVGINST